jgi:hypothetical protein
MPSLRGKFKIRIKKWCAMFKRRSQPGVEEPQNPHQPKQQRTMTTLAGMRPQPTPVA